MDIKLKRVSDYVQEELREYAIYDNTRSIPSIVDGLKTSQRKVIYAVFKTLKNMEDVKTSQLASTASMLTHYKHGEQSITDTVVGMAKDYAGSNNYPLLLKEGQFGTVVDNLNSSPRYIHVKRYDKLDDMFDVDDREIVEYLTYDGISIEPVFYLPKLPLIAINGTIGIGNGYSSKIALRDERLVAKYIYDKLSKGTADKSLLIPSYHGFTGEVEVLGDKSYLLKGVIDRVNTTTTVIRDLPPTSSFQYERYKERVLLPLLENRQSGLIDIENESKENTWEIILKHTRDFSRVDDEELLNKLKMTEKFTENLTVWGFDGKLKVYESISDLVDDWIDNKFGYIQKRKTHILSKMNVKKSWLENLLILINYWLENDLTKIKKVELIEKLKTVVDNEEHINKFLDQNIMSLTIERVDKIKKELKDVTKEYKILEKKSVTDIFIEDITQFI